MLTRAASRAFSTEALKVVNNVAKQQFTVTLHGVDAALDYKEGERNITFFHTNVPEVFQGKGVGKLLAQYAFGFAQENNLDVTCKCHFLANFYEKNRNKYKDIKVTLELD